MIAAVEKTARASATSVPSGVDIAALQVAALLKVFGPEAPQHTNSPILCASYGFPKSVRQAGTCEVARVIWSESVLDPTVYLYDGPNLLEEIDQSGNLLARYSGGPGIDEPLAEVRSGSATYYEADGVGSVTSLTSASSTITGTYSYDSLGNLSASTGTVTNPHRYTGREFDAEAGIYEYRARYYDPAVGRFLSEDPIGFSGSVDFYTYTNNNPLNWTDPFGWDRVRVCCRPLRFMKPLLLFRIWHHCYIQITDADGTQTWGVLPPQPNQDDGSGQQPRVHDPRNSGGGCQDVPCKTCKTDGLRQKLRNSEFPVGTCPSCGPNYSNSWWAFDGNNSNTYVYNMINSTCGTPPREPRAPGYHFAPGW